MFNKIVSLLTRSIDSAQTQAFNISVQGASHIKHKKVCQDNSLTYTDGDNFIAVVCDGHGGDNYFRSDKGSLFACESAYECLTEFLKNCNKFIKSSYTEKNAMIGQLEKSIIEKWNQKVHDDLKIHPFEENELENVTDNIKNKYLMGEKVESAYGTTIIAAVVTSFFWIGLQLGDGKCVILQKDMNFSQPIPWNDKCFLNTTTSLCDFDAFTNFRHYFSETIPIAIYLGTDGIDDSFGNDEELYSLYKVISNSFGEIAFADAVKELSEYLPRLSAKGSGDDMSIAAIININKLKQSVQSSKPSNQ